MMGGTQAYDQLLVAGLLGFGGTLKLVSFNGKDRTGGAALHALRLRQ